MSIKHTEEFKQEAVRIAVSSGLPRARIAADLGVGKSTLSKWISVYRPADMPVSASADLAKENERLRLDIRVLREGEEAQMMRGIIENRTEILKKAQEALGSSSRAKNHEVRFC
jgi:transposase